jgi:hypothetical protein
MKLLSFIILTLLSFSSYSVEFSRCIDDKGQVHIINLPKSNLGTDCKLKEDHYTVMLNQDYQNLSEEFKKYEVVKEEPEETFFEDTDLSLNTISNPVKDILDPDKALEQLMDATEDRDDPFTRAMRGRSNAFEKVIEAK